MKAVSIFVAIFTMALAGACGLETTSKIGVEELVDPSQQVREGRRGGQPVTPDSGFIAWSQSRTATALKVWLEQHDGNGAAEILVSAWEERPCSPLDSEDYRNAMEYFGLLGTIYYHSQAYPFARKAYEQAREFWQHTNGCGVDRIARIHLYLGSCYTRLGDYERAEALLEQGIIWAKESGNVELQLQLIGDVGIVYRMQGNWDKAKHHYLNGLNFAKDFPLRKGMMQLNLGLLYLDFPLEYQKLDSAGTYLTNALKGLETIKTQGAQVGGLSSKIADAMQGLARWEMLRKDTTQAQKRIQEVIDYRLEESGEKGTRELAKSYVLAGELGLQAHQPKVALRDFHHALNQLFSEEVKFDNPVFPENALLDALSGIAQCNFEVGIAEADSCSLIESLRFYDWAEAVEDTLEAEFLMDESQRIQATARHQRTECRIEALYELYNRTGDPAFARSALIASERTKANTLRRKLFLLNGTGFLPDQAAEQCKKIIQLKREITEWQDWDRGKEQWGEVLRLQDSLQLLETKLAHQYPSLFAQWLQPVSFSIDSVQAQLAAQGQKMLVMYIGESRGFRFVLDGNSLLFLPLPPTDSMNTWAKEMWNSLEAMQDGTSAAREKAINSYFHAGNALRRAIWDSIPMAWMAEGTRWVIVPDGDLAAVSLGALPLEKPANWHDFGAYRYLGTRMAFTYAYAATLFQLGNEPKPSIQNGNGLSFFDLHQTAQNEPSYLATQFSNGLKKSRDLTSKAGKDATKAAFMQACQQSESMILWGHHPVNGNPWDIAFHFAGGDSLSVAELWTIHDSWTLNWMVNWACEVGNGQYSGGEGMVSQAMGLMAAGCPSLVASSQTVHEKNYPWLTEFVKATEDGIPLDMAILKANQAHFTLNGNQTSAVLPHNWATMMLWGDSQPRASNPYPGKGRMFLGIAILIISGMAFIFFRMRLFRP